ncbi:TPA: adhesin, partial [Salmonella enterica subsp. enterica serovar Typhimurium var. 5-]|nr:adhesin [Salmonella enterica subsp. enterica serovar Typhimurium var. 5-]
MKKPALLFSFLLIFSIFISGCGNDAAESGKKNDNLIQVYTTVYPLQYFAQQIGGDYVNVETIYPPGADEHTFEPSQKDMMDLADADLFFYVGLGLEGFVDKAGKTLENEDVKMVPVAEGLHLDEGGHEEESEEDHEEHAEDEHAEHGDDEHAHGDIDPHVWLDPVYANELALVIKDQLSEQMPEN